MNSLSSYISGRTPGGAGRGGNNSQQSQQQIYEIIVVVVQYQMDVVVSRGRGRKMILYLMKKFIFLGGRES